MTVFRLLSVYIALLVGGFVYAKENTQICFLVRDKRTNEVMPGVVLQASKNKYYTTDNNGRVCLSFGKRKMLGLNLTSLGYISKHVDLNIKRVPKVIYMQEAVERLEEVVVSGSLADRAKKKMTIAVDVVNSDFIKENLGGSLMQTLEKVGGVTSVEIGSGQSKPVIRGLSFNRVLVAEKGLKHEGQQWGADHGLEIDQYDVQNVEVLKGPSSLSFGSDAIGGVINIKRNSFPEPNSLHAEVSSAYMSNNHSISSSAKVEKRTNHFLVGARATGVKYSDYRVPANSVNIYSYTVHLPNHYLRNTAGYEYDFHFHTGYVRPEFHSVFYFSNYNAKSGFFANAHGLEPFGVDTVKIDASNSDIDYPLQRVNHLKVTNETAVTIDEHRLKLLMSYQKNNRAENANYVAHGYMPSKLSDTLGIPEDSERDFDKGFYTAKLTDEFQINNHKLKVGIDANYQKNKIGGWGFIIPAFEQYALGVFAIDSYSFSESLKINAGLRYDYGKIDITKYQDWFPTTLGSGKEEYIVRSPDIDREFSNVSFSCGLIYNVKNWTLKTNIGKSFRMPTAKELGADGVNYHYFRYERGDKDLPAEESYQWDFGAEWKTDKWLVELSPFVNYFSNYIYLNPTGVVDDGAGAGNQIFQYVEAEVFRWGGELHISRKLWEHLRLTSVSEYVKSTQLSGPKKKYGLPFAPPFSSTLEAKYSFANMGCMRSPYLSVDFKYTAKQTDIVPGEEITNAYQVVNMGLGSDFRIGHYTAQFTMQLKNVFDKRYMNHTNFYRLIGLPEQGRNLMVSLKFAF